MQGGQLAFQHLESCTISSIVYSRLMQLTVHLARLWHCRETCLKYEADVPCRKITSHSKGNWEKQPVIRQEINLCFWKPSVTHSLVLPIVWVQVLIPAQLPALWTLSVPCCGNLCSLADSVLSELMYTAGELPHFSTEVARTISICCL